LFDIHSRHWSKQITHLLDLDPGILPTALESEELAGKVTKVGSKATGLANGTPVVAGAGDNATGALGMSLVDSKRTGITIGTSGVAFAVSDSPQSDIEGRVLAGCHAVPNKWYVSGVTQAAGFSLRWFRENFDPNASFDELVAAAQKIEPGADGLLWTPYLMGERTPHIDPDARASLIGLSANHTKAHVVRAILEGVAFSLRECIEVFRDSGIPVERIRLGGGGARSLLWRQIQSDIYGVPVETLRAEEGAAFGAALLAGVQTGVWKSIEEACSETVRILGVIEPDPKNSEVLNQRFEAYRMVYDAVRPVLKAQTKKAPDS